MTAQSLAVSRFIPASFQRLAAPKPVATQNKPSRDYIAELEALAAKIFKSDKDPNVFFVKDGGVLVDVERALVDKQGKIYGFRKPGVELRLLTVQIAFLMEGVRREQNAPHAMILHRFKRRLFPTQEEAAATAWRKLEAAQAVETKRADALKAQKAAEATKKAARIAKAALAEAKRSDPSFGACKALAPKAKESQANKKNRERGGKK